MSRTIRKIEYGSAAGTNQRVELRQRGWVARDGRRGELFDVDGRRPAAAGRVSRRAGGQASDGGAARAAVAILCGFDSGASGAADAKSRTSHRHDAPLGLGALVDVPLRRQGRHNRLVIGRAQAATRRRDPACLVRDSRSSAVVGRAAGEAQRAVKAQKPLRHRATRWTRRFARLTAPTMLKYAALPSYTA